MPNTTTTTVRATFLVLALAATLTILSGVQALSSSDAHAAWAQAHAAAVKA